MFHVVLGLLPEGLHMGTDRAIDSIAIHKLAHTRPVIGMTEKFTYFRLSKLT